MYKNILIPVALDHEHFIAPAMEIARRLKAEGGKITAVHVMEAVPAYASQYLPEGQLERRMEEAVKALEDEVASFDDVESIVVSGHAGRTIIEWAEENEIDLIVIASHRPGLQDYFLGSTAARVVRHSGCNVHVLR